MDEDKPFCFSLSHTGVRQVRPPILRISRVPGCHARGFFVPGDRSNGTIAGMKLGIRASGKMSGRSFDVGIAGYRNTASGEFCATLIELLARELDVAGEVVLEAFVVPCLDRLDETAVADDDDDVALVVDVAPERPPPAPDADALFVNVAGVDGCTARFCGRSAVDMPLSGRRYTGF